jgi:hypothetical protein
LHECLLSTDLRSSYKLSRGPRIKVRLDWAGGLGDTVVETIALPEVEEEAATG